MTHFGERDGLLESIGRHVRRSTGWSRAWECSSRAS